MSATPDVRDTHLAQQADDLQETDQTVGGIGPVGGCTQHYPHSHYPIPELADLLDLTDPDGPVR